MNEKLKHTQGKLYVSAVGVGFEIESENGACIAQTQQISAFDQMSGSFERKTNARRLTACWNACEGVPTKMLEQYSSPFSELRAQRDELLEALRALGSAFMSHTQWNGEPPAEILQARAAINKALGVEA